MKQCELNISVKGRGLTLITGQVIDALPLSPDTSGLLNLFIPHTSASLLIQENADPTAKEDLETFIHRLIPDGEDWHRHTLEGPDDSSSHMKAAITQSSINIPVMNGKLALGTWQGIYLWEHRLRPQNRRLILTLMT